jgi:hypothetical protein
MNRISGQLSEYATGQKAASQLNAKGPGTHRPDAANDLIQGFTSFLPFPLPLSVIAEVEKAPYLNQLAGAWAGALVNCSGDCFAIEFGMNVSIEELRDFGEVSK